MGMIKFWKNLKKKVLMARMKILEKALQVLAGEFFEEEIFIAYVPLMKEPVKIEERKENTEW